MDLRDWPHGWDPGRMIQRSLLCCSCNALMQTVIVLKHSCQVFRERVFLLATLNGFHFPD